MDRWRCNYLTEWKTLWKKEKLLITSNFSFSHIVFKSCLLLMRQNEYLWNKGSTDGWMHRHKHIYARYLNETIKWHVYSLTLYHKIATFNDPKERSLLKTLWEKENMLVTSIFSFSHNVFYPSKSKFQFLNHI